MQIFAKTRSNICLCLIHDKMFAVLCKQQRKMDFAIFLLLLISTSIVSGDQDAKIIGGTPTDITAFPFTLSLRFYTLHVCGASAISSTWAVTAAHCLDSGYPASVIKLRAGATSRLSGGTIMNTKAYHIHPNYSKVSMTFDVAVVNTLQPFPFTKFAILPIAGLPLAPMLRVETVGWGYTETGQLSDRLLKVKIPIISESKCSKAWGSYYTETSLCAGRLNKDSCSGDSGGPLVFLKRVLVGIVSFGSENCGSKVPGVYTKVSYPPVLTFIQVMTGVH